MLISRMPRTLAVLLIVALAAAACTPAAAPAVQPTQPPAPLQEPSTLPPTVTTAPTQTSTPSPLPPTATLEPTAADTATPAPPPQPSVSAWCVLKDKAFNVKRTDSAAMMPEGATPAKLEGNILVLSKPSTDCTVLFDLGVPFQAGEVLEVMDGTKAVWLKVPLTAVPGSANAGYALLKHTYLVEPPYWTIFYPVVLRGADGAELWSGQIEARNSWMPDKCWNGVLPNFKTLACQKQQDLHPWDYAYTPPPPEVP